MNTSLSMRVLVVDDNHDIAVSLATLLRHCGHEAHTAESGEAALREAPALRPDVMLIDLAMPRIDGLSVARQLRQTPECATTPLVAVSGYSDDEHRDQALAAGFDAFIVKPCPLADLMQVLLRLHARVVAGRERPPAAAPAAAPANAPAAIWVGVEKSGICELLSLEERLCAEELRLWLKQQGCRVGQLFTPDDGKGHICFFVYSTRRYPTVRPLLARHGGYSAG
jgi:CheY-like chemotaxis protein